MEALKQRLSALKANAAADGGADNIVKARERRRKVSKEDELRQWIKEE